MEDTESDAIVRAALALIDDAYSDNVGPTKRVRPTTRVARDALQIHKLREEIASLERELALRQYGPQDGPHSEARWAHVAASQRGQRERADQENTELRECVEAQRRLARQLLRTVEMGGLVLRGPAQNEHGFVSTGPGDGEITRTLLRRLRAIETRVSPGWLGLLPSIGPEYRRRDTELHDTGRTVTFRSQYASYMPFKLSLVASELWRLMLEDLFGSERLAAAGEQLADDASGCMSLRLALAHSNQLKVHGPAILRRVFTSDGSVLLMGVSRTSGGIAADDGIVRKPDSYEMQEVEWLKIGRSLTAPALVRIESVTTIEIRVLGDQPESTSMLETVRESLLRESKRVGARKGANARKSTSRRHFTNEQRLDHFGSCVMSSFVSWRDDCSQNNAKANTNRYTPSTMHSSALSLCSNQKIHFSIRQRDVQINGQSKRRSTDATVTTQESHPAFGSRAVSDSCQRLGR